jgi:CheY-like chemotaxis protein
MPELEARRACFVNRMVLIADGNTGRGRRLAEACERVGVPCKTGPHGAAALEMALSERPGLVVAQLDLPLVDAAKLAEILRANPRTRRSRFLFLGEESERASLAAPGDLLLPSGSSTEELVRIIEEMVARQDRLDAVDAATTSGEPIDGDLSLVRLADLVSLFQANRTSGRLELRRSQAESADDRSASGVIWLRDGDVLQAEAGRTSNEKAFFRLLGWRQGRFGFRPGSVDEPAFIATPTRVLLQEGLRQIGEWERLSTKLPPLDSQVRMRLSTSDLPNIVHPLTQEVLLLLEIYGTVGEVVDRCSFPDYQVLRTLQTLADREIVEIGQAEVQTRPAVREVGGDGVFNEAQIRRLREWVEARASQHGPLPPAKLLIAASDASGLPDFANLIRELPGASLTIPMARGEIGPDDLATVGRIEFAPDLCVELVQIPRSEAFAPIWPLAGHRALGTLFLLSGPVGAAAESLSPMCEVLAEIPRARTFHVVLLRKGERISPDELRANLSLIDEASLFLLPLESDKEPTPLLRGLFSRILP